MYFLLLLLTWKIVSSWGFLFAHEVMAEIIARTLTATPPRYSTIKELDRKIHEYAVSPETVELIRGGPGVDPSSVPLPASMMAFMLATLHDVRKSLSLPHTIALWPEQKTFESPCSFIATFLSRPSSKTPTTR
jgi:hypothetical protein